jgi:hypothetical protein
LLVEMLEPFKGRVYEPAFGSGGLFVQSGRFVQAHGGRTADIALYGQENNQATWRIGKMNLAIHGLSGDLKLGNTLLDDQHRDLRADFLMANPPFNMKNWGAAQVADDVRWKYGSPPDGNANYAWIQHFIHHLAPDGKAGFVMANGSLSAGGGEGKIRQEIIEDDLVDCIVALPPQLFFTTQIPVHAEGQARARRIRGAKLVLAQRGLVRYHDVLHAEAREDRVCFALQLAGGGGAPEHSQGTRLPRERMGVLEDIAERPPVVRRLGVQSRSGLCLAVGLRDDRLGAGKPVCDSRRHSTAVGGDPARLVGAFSRREDAAHIRDRRKHGMDDRLELADPSDGAIRVTIEVLDQRSSGERWCHLLRLSGGHGVFDRAGERLAGRGDVSPQGEHACLLGGDEHGRDRGSGAFTPGEDVVGHPDQLVPLTQVEERPG